MQGSFTEGSYPGPFYLWGCYPGYILKCKVILSFINYYILAKIRFSQHSLTFWVNFVNLNSHLCKCFDSQHVCAVAQKFYIPMMKGFLCGFPFCLDKLCKLPHMSLLCEFFGRDVITSITDSPGGFCQASQSKCANVCNFNYKAGGWWHLVTKCTYTIIFKTSPFLLNLVILSI